MTEGKTPTTELSTIAQRQVGRAWIQLYGHMIADDPAFAAAAIWRCMWMARYEPDSHEIQHLFKEARDSIESGRMPSGLPLAPDAAALHRSAVERLEAML
jgi:hypothetical protein